MTTSTLPAGAAIGRVALLVADLDRLVAFYRDVVGLRVLDRTDDRATLGVDGRPLLELHADAEAMPRASDEAGLFHTAFRVPHRGALGAALERIEDAWRLTGASDHRVSEALYLRDPEDNGVEIYRDRERDVWPTDDGRVQMDTLPLDLDALRADADDEPELPPEADIGHVHLEVTDVETAREFYVDTVGFEIRQAWNGALFVAAGGYHHHVGLNVWNARSRPGSGRGLAWFEVVVPGEALPDVRHRLESADGIVSETPDGLSVRDADGIEIRFTSDR